LLELMLGGFADFAFEIGIGRGEQAGVAGIGAGFADAGLIGFLL